MANLERVLSAELTVNDIMDLERITQRNWEYIRDDLGKKGWSALRKYSKVSNPLGPQDVNLGGSGEFFFGNRRGGGCGWEGHSYYFRPTGGIVIAYGEGKNVACVIIDPGASFYESIPIFEDMLEKHFGRVPSVNAIVASSIHPDHSSGIGSCIQYATRNAKARGEIVVAVNRTIAVGAADAKGSIQDFFHSRRLPKETMILTWRDPGKVKKEIEEWLSVPEGIEKITPEKMEKTVPTEEERKKTKMVQCLECIFQYSDVRNELTVCSSSGGYELSLKATFACHRETPWSGLFDVFGLIVYANREPRAIITGDTAFLWDLEKGIPPERAHTRTLQLEEPPEEVAKKKLVVLEEIPQQYRKVRGVPIAVVHPARTTYQVWQGRFITHDDNHGRLDLAQCIGEEVQPGVLVMNELAAENYLLHPETVRKLRKYGIEDIIEFGWKMLTEKLPGVKVVAPTDHNIIVI